MSKRTVLYIEDSWGVGGSMVSLCNFLEHLDRTRFEPVVLVYHDNQKAYLESRKLAVSEVLVASPRPPLRQTVVGKVLFSVVSQGGWGEQEISRVCSAMDFLWSICPYAFSMWRRLRGRHIAFVHLNTGVCLPGIVLSWFLGVSCMATQRGPEYLSKMIGWFATFVKQFIAISQVTKEDLLKLGVSENKIVVKNPPVDCTRFDFTIRPSGLRASFFVDERAPLFGIFGILEKWKGHRVFLEAAQEVLDAVPGSIAFVVGDTPGGDRAYREELDAQCHRLGISKRVIFTGFREDVPELMAMLDVVVHASIIPEPFGKVVIEAMAMRKPVVATAAGGPTEIIRPGHDGLLVPPRDPRPMAECIIRLLRDRELAAKIGSAGLETVRARYGVTEYVNAVEGIYDSVMGCS